MNAHRASRITALGIVLALGCTRDPLVVTAPPPPPPAPLLGSVFVSVSVSGRDADPDGFTVQLGDGQRLPLTPQSPVNFRNVPPGTYAVRLDGIAPNCEVQTANPWIQALSFVDGLTASVQFDVFCMTHGTGRLRIGVSRGFDEFGISIADGPVVPRQGNPMDVTEVLPGTHAVRLVLDTGECTLDGPNPVSADVSAGRTTYVGFIAYCTLVVSVNTTGENQPAGYTAYLEQPGDFYCYESCYGLSVNATGTVAFTVFPTTEYRISLRAVPQNCTAAPASHGVNIPARGKGSVAFAVSCR